MVSVDLVLPFGLHSAPFTFNSVAELVEWILHHNYSISNLLHYLDDYITAGPAESLDCACVTSRVNTILNVA